MARAARGHSPRVMVNHIGYTPRAGKHVVVDGVRGARRFNVVNMRQLGYHHALEGKLVRGGADLGRFLIGDFSALQEPGIYRVSVEGDYGIAGRDGKLKCWSHNFTVGDNVWDDPLAALVHYYRAQSCGASREGYNTPCHVGDIARDDGKEPRPLPGAWHSAHDCSRKTSEILHGMFGLIALAAARPDLIGRLDLLHEIRWGNDYFLSIQDDAGFIYHGVTGGTGSWLDPIGHDWWDSNTYTLAATPAVLYLQFHFIAIQALVAQLFAKKDPAYADRCLESAHRCFAYSQKNGGEWTDEPLSYELGGALSAAVHLYRATGSDTWREFARKTAERLVLLQAPQGHWEESNRGAPQFDLAALESKEHMDPAQVSWFEFVCLRAVYAWLPVLGLVEAARWLDDDSDRPRWVAALEHFTDTYLKHFAKVNAFGLIPYRAFAEAPVQTSREWHGVHYRYFVETNYWIGPMFWQAGDIATRAMYGVCMVYLSEILGAPWLKALAHRQLDWALGVNPFDSSMIWGIGRNQTPTYPSLEMIPPVPDIHGAVFQGIGGDEDDTPLLIPGCYVTGEFWMPHQSSLTWLMAELSSEDASCVP